MNAELIIDALRAKVADLEQRLEASHRELAMAGSTVHRLRERLAEYEDEDEEEDEVKQELTVGRREEVRRAAAFLLGLEGAAMIRGGERDDLEAVFEAGWTYKAEVVEWINELLAGREREARLRGESWGWEGGAL